MKKILTIVFILLILAVVVSGIYIVGEMEQVVVTQFGKPVGDPVFEAGIHFKIPLIQKANFFDRRFLEWDGDPNQIPTKDKRFISVDTYARWRISDPLLFFQRVYDERGAQSRLDDIIDGETRSALASFNLVEIIRSNNREVQMDADSTENLQGEIFLTIEKGREQIAQLILENAAKRTAELGIELLDFQFKRINYVQEVQQKIYERMITERKRIADKYRSEGQGEASKILGDKERELRRIRSEAYRQAQRIMGDADAEAAAIYARAYNKNQAARDLYAFMKSMEAYKVAIKKEDWLILSTDSEFFRFLQESR